MRKKKETIKSLCDEMLFEIDQEWYIERILAAHNREMAEKDCHYNGEMNTMSLEIVRLKERIALLEKALKSSCRWIKCHDIYHTSGVDILKEAKELLHDNGEFLFKENK